MLYMKVLCQCTDCVIDEVTLLVTHQYPFSSKQSDNVFKLEPHYCCSGAIYNRCSLHPSCQIVYHCNDVPCTISLPMWVYWSHKFHKPFIKWLQCHLRYQRHLIPPLRFPSSLTEVTIAHIVYHITIESGPPKLCEKNLPSSSATSVVPTCDSNMCLYQYFPLFMW